MTEHLKTNPLQVNKCNFDKKKHKNKKNKNKKKTKIKIPTRRRKPDDLFDQKKSGILFD